MSPLWQFLNGLPQVGPLRIAQDIVSFVVGSGSATATLAGVLTTNTTQAGTIADTNETDLWTYTLPANSLNANGKSVRIRVVGSTAANGNTKTVRLYFGGTVIRTIVNGASNNETWGADALVVRTGAATEFATTHSIVAGTPTIVITAAGPSADTTAAIVIKVTGQNGTASANDIVFRAALVECL